MSEENVEVVRRMFEVFLSGLGRGDPGAPFDQGLAAPDAEWRPIREFVGARSYIGRDGFVEFITMWTGGFETWTMQLEQVLDAGDDRVVALMHQSGIGKESGAPVEWKSGAVLELEDRRVTRVQVYLNTSEALEAAGLSE
jgi:ketosteroid isomerase-like protein